MKAWLERLGMAGVGGLGLLLFSLSFYVGNVIPEGAERDRLARKLAQGRAAATTGQAGAGTAPDLSMEDLPELLKRLAAIAVQNGLQPEHTDYLIKDSGGVSRLEISLPLKASYPSIRAYLRGALALAPHASLDELTLQRSQATDPLLEAQLRFSFPLGTAP